MGEPSEMEAAATQGMWAAEDERDQARAEAQRLREALEDLVRWAALALDGLEYEDEAEREELWERLAGDVSEPNALDRATHFINEDSP